MGWFDSFTGGNDYDSSPHSAVYGEKEHQSKWTHELVGGAAGFEAMRLYEQHQAANGKAPSHQLAKEVLAGIAAAEVDKLFETKGLDAIDRERAKHHAKQQACRLYDEQYGTDDY